MLVFFKMLSRIDFLLASIDFLLVSLTGNELIDFKPFLPVTQSSYIRVTVRAH